MDVFIPLVIGSPPDGERSARATIGPAAASWDGSPAGAPCAALTASRPVSQSGPLEDSAPATRRRPQHRRPCSRPPGQPCQLAHGGLPDSGGGAISIGDEPADEGHMRKTVIIAIATAAALTAGCSSNTAVDDAAAAPTTDALAAAQADDIDVT